MLVVDTNVLFSFFSNKRLVEIFEKLYLKKVRLFTPEFVMEELESLKDSILKGISENEFKLLFKLLSSLVKVVPKSEYGNFLDEAKKISPHVEDAPLFALSLAFKRCPIWSRDRRLKRQKIVEVLTDAEVEKRYLK